MITIISPAKTMDYSNNPQISVFSIPEFLDNSELLIRNLSKLNLKDISTLMGVSDKIATLTVERFLQWSLPFSEENAKQALLVFKGEVYRGLEAESLKESDLNFAQNHLRILSGLYGILKPLDLIQPYRLEMGIKFSNKRGKNLYEFWGNILSEALNKEFMKHENPVLVNLASNEYYKAIKPRSIKAKIISPVFKEQKGNDFKVITVYAKKARGLMSRFIIENQIDQMEDLKAFDYEGYLFSPSMSTPTEFVFVR